MVYKAYGIRIFYHKGTNMPKWFKTIKEQDDAYKKYKAKVKLMPKASGRDVKYVKKIGR